MNKPAEILLLAVQHAACRVRNGQRAAARELDEGRVFNYGSGTGALTAAAASVALEELVVVAERYISDCPELGITRELLDLALTAEEPSALFLR